MSYYQSYKKIRKPWVIGLSNFIYDSMNNNMNYNKKKEKKKNNNFYIGNGDYYVPENDDNEGYTDIFYNDNYQKNNGSNLCFMNSSIQCLSHLISFREWIIKFNFSTNKGNKNLLMETKKLFEEMKNENYPLKSNVLGIKKVMSEVDERYKYNNQEDANEFISIFLDELLEETKCGLETKENKTFKNKIEEDAYNKIWRKFYSKKGGSFLVPLFYGLLKTEKKCNECDGIISIDFNTFNMLELSIYNYKDLESVKLEKILSDFYGKKLSNKNKQYCYKCKNETTNYNITTIYSLPKYLIIYFGRTIDNEYINLNIEYGKTLKLSPYIRAPKKYKNDNSDLFNIESKESEFDDNKNEYSLCNIIHYNSSYNSKSGHYTATCLCDDDWYHFNDSFISEENEISDFYNREIILFYEKRYIDLRFFHNNQNIIYKTDINDTLNDIKKKYFRQNKTSNFYINGKLLDQTKKIKYFLFDPNHIIKVSSI